MTASGPALDVDLSEAPGEGRAVAHGAVTVVNAIPTGLGAALGIDLRTEARVRLTDGAADDDDPSPAVTVEALGPDGPVDDRLVRAALDLLLPTGAAARVEVESTIPVGCGLKSSSASANAVVVALLRALGRADDVDLLDAVRLGVACARKAGVTATGAFDDACASALGGLCVTDNGRDALLARFDAPRPADLAVVLRVPAVRKEARTTEAATYAPHRRLFEAAHRFAVEGSWASAFALNATAVSASVGLDDDPALDALAAGAVVAGPTGTGPALAALCPDDRLDAVREAFEAPDVTVMTARPVREAMA